MEEDSPLSGEKDVIVDANIFIAIGDPSNPKFTRFRRAVQEAGLVLKLPQRVIPEIGGRDTDRIQTALDEGWAEIIDAPDPTDGDAIAASDIARRTIANTTGQPEHEVEKTDTILAGIVTVPRYRHRTTPRLLTPDRHSRVRGVTLLADGFAERRTSKRVTAPRPTCPRRP